MEKSDLVQILKWFTGYILSQKQMMETQITLKKEYNKSWMDLINLSNDEQMVGKIDEKTAKWVGLFYQATNRFGYINQKYSDKMIEIDESVSELPENTHILTLPENLMKEYVEELNKLVEDLGSQLGDK